MADINDLVLSGESRARSDCTYVQPDRAPLSSPTKCTALSGRIPIKIDRGEQKSIDLRTKLYNNRFSNTWSSIVLEKTETQQMCHSIKSYFQKYPVPLPSTQKTFFHKSHNNNTTARPVNFFFPYKLQVLNLPSIVHFSSNPVFPYS